MTEPITIRPCRPEDTDALYHICLLTADSGGDGSQLYDDPQLPGLLFAAPYARLEPGLASVAVDGAGVCGYVVGALDTTRFLQQMERSWLPPLQRIHAHPAGEPSSWNDSDHVRHRIHVPEKPPAVLDRFPSHLHINLLPRAQGQGVGRRLLTRLFEQLRQGGSPGVHLGVMERNQGAVGFYRRLGFQILLSRGPAADRVIYMGLPL